MTYASDRVDPDVADLIISLVGGHECSPANDELLWKQLNELGLADLTGGPARNGSEASWWESVELVAAVVQAGCDLPVGESDLVAGWLCDVTAVGAGAALRVVWSDDELGNVPTFHPLVERVVVLREHQLADVPVDAVQARLRAGHWGTSVTWIDLDADLGAETQLRLALVRSVQIAAAMETATAIALQHAAEREQFGRALVKFQSVQAQLADMAAETALTRAAVDAAVGSVAVGAATGELSPPHRLAALRSTVAVARSCAGHGAALVARGAHQLVGAIGTTAEHKLHRYTMPMLEWRRDGMDTRAADRLVLADAVQGRYASDLDLNRAMTPPNTTGDQL